jgi:two-component system, NtrC family, sensor kinase
MIASVRALLNRVTGRAWKVRGRLFLKYVAALVVICLALIVYVEVEIWGFYQDRKKSIIRIEQEQAKLAAKEIGDFVYQIETQLAWTTYSPWGAAASVQQRIELWRLLLRQVPAITEVALLDSEGREELRVSRLGLDVVGSGTDFSKDPKFVETVARRVYHGPVYFRSESEPYLTLALARAVARPTVSAAEVNLKFIWNTISQIKVGANGRAYVVDQQGRLIAHPDISLVLRRMDLSNLAQVRAAQAALGEGTGPPQLDQVFSDIGGRRVLASYAPIGMLGWSVLVEVPVDEAFAPLYASIIRAVALLVLGVVAALVVGLFLARRIVRPLEQLEEFATTVRRTRNYNLRLNLNSRGEIAQLAGAFNDMLAELAEARDREVADHQERARVERLTAIGAMTASIAHEIKQPLVAIVSYSNAGRRWLAGTPPNVDKARAVLDQIADAGRRADEVINAIRAIFQKGSNEQVPVDVNQLIIEVLDLARPTVQTNRTSVVRELRDGLPKLLADRIQLQQVLLNLVTNGIEAMETVTDRERVLKVTTDLDESSNVLIDVEDSGTGIDPAQIDRIFSAFFTTKSHGTGLGLAICRSIVEAHGGRLTAKPREQYGSVFQLILPTQATPAH